MTIYKSKIAECMLTSISKGYSLVKTKIGAITVPVDPEIPPTPVEEMVGATANIQDFDFGVVTYRWQQDSGVNLETRTWISTPSRPGYTVGNERQQSDLTYLKWGKPPASVYTETVLIDMSNIIRDHAGNPVININMAGYWYNSVNSGNLNIELITYKGGYMVDNSTSIWSNVGGVPVQSLKLPVTTKMYVNGDSNGQDLAMLSYTVASKTGVLIRAVGAEPIEPPIEEPPVEGSPLMFRTSNFAGDSQELNVVMRLTNTEDDWRIIDNATDLTVMDRNSVQGLTNNVSTFRLNSPGDTDRDYRLEGSVTNLSLVIDEDYQANGSVTIDAFSDVISEYQLDVKSAEVTVPSTLPNHITVTDKMFAGCTNITQDISQWDVSHVTSMYGMFDGCTNFNQDISEWDVSSVTNMSNMFSGCANFNQPIGDWDVSNVTTIGGMFRGCTVFNQPLSGWQTQSMTNIRECFYRAQNFNQDISTWNVENVHDMQYMFFDASSFAQDLSTWTTTSLYNLEGMFKDAILFNSDISEWDVSQVTNISAMFQNAVSFNQPLNSWDISSVYTMHSIFYEAKAFNQPLDTWDVSKVTERFAMNEAFLGATSFNQDLSNWCVPELEYSDRFDLGASSWFKPRPPWGFCGLEVVNNLEFTITTGNVALDNDRLTIGFPEGMPGTFKILKDGVLTNTSPDGYDSDIMNQYGQIAIYVPPNTTRTFTLQASAPVAQLKYYTDNAQSTNKIAIDAFSDNILRYEFSIKNADLTVPQTLPVHITSMFAMFNGSNRFNQDLSGWDVSRITNATDAFRDCVAFNGNVGTWRLDKLGNAYRMFMGCNVFNQPLNNWRFPELRVAVDMFSGCSAFNQDLNSWNVSGIRDFEGMFSGCTVFNGTITDWDMTGAAVLRKMFYNCRAFNQPIGNWNVASVSNFDGMFSYAISFNQDISTWDMSGVKNVNGLANMFAQAIGFNQDLSTWNVLKVPSRPYEFDSGLTTTWTLPRPKWGTDGKPIIVPPIVPYDSNSFNVLIEQTETQSPTVVNITLTLNQDASNWEVWIGDEMIASPQYAKAPVTVSNKTITIPNSNNRTQIAVKGTMSTVALLLASPTSYTSLGKITTSVINYSPTINSYRFTVKEAALTVPDTLPSHITSLSEMFKECTNILSDITGWDTSNIMYATSMLNGATNFNQDLSGWNVFNIKSKPTSFDDYCNSWTLPRPIWGTTGVVATPLTIEIDNRAYTEIKTFVVKVPRLQEPVVKINDDVVYANGVVASGSSMNIVGDVRILYLGVPPSAVSTFVVGGTLNHFDISTNAGTNESTIFNVLNFSDTISGYTFSVKGSLLTVPQELSPVITSTYEMFHECKNFNQDIGDWDVSNVVNMDRMFRWAINFNQDLSRWNVTRFVSEPEHFSFAVPNWTLPKPVWGTTGVQSINYIPDALNVSFASNSDDDRVLNLYIRHDGTESWHVQDVVNDKLIADSDGFKADGVQLEFPVNHVNKGVVRISHTDKTEKHYSVVGNMDKIFVEHYSVKDNSSVGSGLPSEASLTIHDYSPNIAAYVFSTGYADLILPNELASHITDLSYMIYECLLFNQDISSWNTSNVTDMSGMFEDATSFNSDLSSWDVSLVTNMEYMFFNAGAFNQDISNWDVSNVTNMSGMFNSAKSFNQDLSGWNVTNISALPDEFDDGVTGWTLPRPIWGSTGTPVVVPPPPTVDCTGATENVKLNISGGVSDLRYKVEINGHVFNEDGGVDISTGWHTVAPALYFMCEDNGDNTLTMTVYEDYALNTLPVKLTPISHLTTATITGGDTVANPTFKYDEGTSSISFCVITEWAA